MVAIKVGFSTFWSFAHMTLPRNHHITEIIDIEALGELFQHLTNATGILTAVLDMDGNILIATKWQDICANFHRSNPETAAHCRESDTILAGQLEAGQKYNVYRCKNGLIDIVVPIVVDNTHIGNLFTGQFFFEEPDFQYFEQRAFEFDFDREAYLEALSRVPVFNREDIEKTINLLCKMAQVVGEMGLNKLRITEANRELVTANTQLQEEVSERKQAERLLREEEGRYRALFNSSRDAIVILAPSSRFVDGNPAALQLFGCQNKAEFIGKNPMDISPEYQPDGVLSSVKAQEMASLVMEKGGHLFEWKHQRVNGEEFFASVLLTKMHLHDKLFLQATVRDVTESKLSEERLKRYQNHLEELVAGRTAELDKANQCLQQDVLLRLEAEDKLREANQELEAFAYTVSHDLRSSLTPIIGYTELLEALYKERLDGKALSFLAKIGAQGYKMLAQMEDHLVLARMGHLERPAEPVAADKVAREVINNLAKPIAKSGMIVTQGSLPAIHIPESLISRIFDNLIGNAIRYGGRKGSTIEVGGERKGKRVQFFVRDHGPGIPQEERGRIFEVFFRGTSGKNLKGTGVGLATVLKITRTYGGLAWVEETPGGGSTFWVEMLDVPPAAEDEKDIL
jgi:PAS domain S-box-containing protein